MEKPIECNASDFIAFDVPHWPVENHMKVELRIHLHSVFPGKLITRD